jgi:hypothetical protein
VEFFPDASLFSDQQTFTSQSQGRPEPFSTWGQHIKRIIVAKL